MKLPLLTQLVEKLVEESMPNKQRPYNYYKGIETKDINNTRTYTCGSSGTTLVLFLSSSISNATCLAFWAMDVEEALSDITIVVCCSIS